MTLTRARRPTLQRARESGLPAGDERSCIRCEAPQEAHGTGGRSAVSHAAARACSGCVGSLSAGGERLGDCGFPLGDGGVVGAIEICQPRVAVGREAREVVCHLSASSAGAVRLERDRHRAGSDSRRHARVAHAPSCVINHRPGRRMAVMTGDKDRARACRPLWPRVNGVPARGPLSLALRREQLDRLLRRQSNRDHGAATKPGGHDAHRSSAAAVPDSTWVCGSGRTAGPWTVVAAWSMMRA